MNTGFPVGMARCLGRFSLIAWLGLATIPLFPAAAEYRSSAQIGEWLRASQTAHGKRMRLEILATSPGQRPVYLVRIGGEKNGEKLHRPAVLVVANPSGHLPVATEAALGLIEHLLADPDRVRDTAWYLVPTLNPDAHDDFFASVRSRTRLNHRPVNDDRDDLEGEDPADDLNGDGMISWMRVVDPEGQWLTVESESRLMRRADPGKGEKGVYRLYPEGIDNDGDGEINEDGRGGADPGINFPHLFPDRQIHAGEWPGSESEAFGLMRFAAAHREIAMTLVLGETNFCHQPPRSDRPGEVDPSRIRVPQDLASRLGLDPSRTYTMREIVAKARDAAPAGVEMSESRVASMLGLGAVVNPLPEDLSFYREISAKYRRFLQKSGLPVQRFEPLKDLDGSFELWSYYQLGLPSFSLDLWWLPKEEKKEGEGNGADPREEALLRFCDANPDGPGFVPWKKQRHPRFGEVEIGGFSPYIDQNPSGKDLAAWVNAQLPWIVELVSMRASLVIHSSGAVEEGPGLFRVSAWIENRGGLPYPTAMGARNRRTLPVVVSLEGEDLEYLTGRKRELLPSVGSHSVRKVEWLIRLKSPQTLRIRMSSDYAGGDLKTVRVGGES